MYCSTASARYDYICIVPVCIYVCWIWSRWILRNISDLGYVGKTMNIKINLNGMNKKKEFWMKSCKKSWTKKHLRGCGVFNSSCQLFGNSLRILSVHSFFCLEERILMVWFTTVMRSYHWDRDVIRKDCVWTIIISVELENG